MKRNNGRIDVFTRDYFESVLPANKRTGGKLWERVSVKGEWCYLVEMGYGNEAKIMIRSSVSSSTGQSRGTGQDSIRTYVVDPDTLKPLMGKTKRWTTRKRGWEGRLWTDLSELREQFGQVYSKLHCPKCGKLLPIYENKHNQQYVKCWDCDGDDSWSTYKIIS